MNRSVVAAITALAPLLMLPAVASAEPAPSTLPPVVTLTSNDSSITATITNPNEPQVLDGFTRTCTLAIDGYPEGFAEGIPPFENPDPSTIRTDPTDTTLYPQAGQTVTITRNNLPQGHYSLFGLCGQLSHRGGWLWAAGALSERVELDIWVGPEPQTEPGILGSLDLLNLSP
ncbi:hypothetical protein Rruber_05488 (plasmid) [Rhodococcus ruber]|uniref:hypothetical protein n=1 Tax=Rhodococcus ruber TaxID=1830 RepID=UPI00315D3AD2